MKPVIIELTDFKTKEKVDELEVDACMVATGRAPFTQVHTVNLNLNLIVSLASMPTSELNTESAARAYYPDAAIAHCMPRLHSINGRSALQMAYRRCSS